MAHLLRVMIFLMFVGIALTIATALGWASVSFSHIQLAIPAYLYALFAQAFVMFYFIGIARLVKNVQNLLRAGGDLSQLFDNPPTDLTPYMKSVNKFSYEADTCKRQTIPWSILIIFLGMIAFLLGGAHDTNLVSKSVHSGVVYGFTVAMVIGFFRQWFYLGKAHILLRKIKRLFEIPDGVM